MKEAKKTVRVAIVGLGDVGSAFLAKLAEKKLDTVELIAVAECDPKARGLALAKDLGVEVFSDSRDIVALGEKVDVIFDLTGIDDAKRELRSALARSGNNTTVIAPEVLAHLLWNLLEEGEGTGLPEKHASRGY